jgi:hypothetical protein
MAVQLRISKDDGLAAIERKLATLTSELTPPGQHSLTVYLASDRRSTFFKDIWASMAVATGVDRSKNSVVLAWGLQDWSGLDDVDGLALSHPSLLAMQRGAEICTDRKPRQLLDASAVRRRISIAGGCLGIEGARYRTVVELDPELPRAAVLSKGVKPREAFFDFLRTAFQDLQIATQPSGIRATSPAKNAILEWLFELHVNGYEHARRDNSVRLLRLQKHLYPSRRQAMGHAQHIPELIEYLKTQDERPSNRAFNLVEASISDYGPGILDGFLSTYAGEAYESEPRRELLDRLLHDQLSCKSSDPNAGLGIPQAVEAARSLDAFVSLRTSEFSLYMRGQLDDPARLKFREGTFSSVVGTHWQLLIPDRTVPE